ncbi:MAG TPA: (2Fe-2S)-binding protein [Gammaproteobacteria bacterium]|nr:(2Fe-2S)-binding protein [Gammaproteobacteria bacterium]
MKVTWRLADGREISADATAGETLKDAALAAGVPHILGECGGSMSCATCHVVLPPEWAEKAGPPGEFEDAILDTTEAPRQATSRLSCQIEMHPGLDGLTLIVPEP